jgi:hypothetical protein
MEFVFLLPLILFMVWAVFELGNPDYYNVGTKLNYEAYL